MGGSCCTCIVAVFRGTLIGVACLGLGLLAYSLATQYLPPDTITISETDYRALPGVSGLFCSGTEIWAQRPISVYASSTLPQDAKPHSREAYSLDFEIYKDRHQLRYYLLPGSLLTVTACSKKHGSHIIIVQGKENLDQCLENLPRLKRRIKDSHEASSSEENSSHFADNICAAALISKDIPLFCNREVIRLNILHSDEYYVLVSQIEKWSVPITLRLTLNKTELHPVRWACRDRERCHLPIPFQATPVYPVVHLALEGDAGMHVYEVHARCRPRFFLFFFFLVLLPMACVVCMWLCTRARRAKSKRHLYDEVHEASPSPKEPLLETARVTDYAGINPIASPTRYCPTPSTSPAHPENYSPPPSYEHTFHHTFHPNSPPVSPDSRYQKKINN